MVFCGLCVWKGCGCFWGSACVESCGLVAVVWCCVKVVWCNVIWCHGVGWRSCGHDCCVMWFGGGVFSWHGVLNI